MFVFFYFYGNKSEDSKDISPAIRQLYNRNDKDWQISNSRTFPCENTQME